jgi:hypothetical protein
LVKLAMVLAENVMEQRLMKVLPLVQGHRFNIRKHPKLQVQFDLKRLAVLVG